MSLQWTLVAGFLYLEIAVVFILLLPYISPQRWLKLFRSRILHSLGAQTALYFYGLFGLLLLLFLDAVREMRKYSTEDYDLNVNPKAEMQAHMKLFRAQRNFYISGFALLLSLLIRRIVELISDKAVLLAQNEAAMKQATSATSAAQRLMDMDKNKQPDSDKERVKYDTQINNLKEEVIALTKDRDAIKSQAASVSKEYDRLMSQYEKLEKQLKIAGGGAGDKKSD